MAAEISILKRGNDEQLLVDHLQRLAPFTERGWALHLHLSKLGARSRNENLVFALDILRNLVRQFSGRFFSLKNGDVICTLRTDYLQQLRADVQRVHPLAARRWVKIAFRRPRAQMPPDLPERCRTVERITLTRVGRWRHATTWPER